MKTFRQYLDESWATDDSGEHKAKYHDQVHKLLSTSYKTIGGYGGHDSGSEGEHKAITADIMHPHHILKVNSVHGNVTSAAIYKKEHGRKLIALGTDGSQQGKIHANRIISEDNKHKRSWAEVSGAVEHLNKKHGTPDIPNELAEKLTGKVILKHNADNSYDRTIGGQIHTKRLMGHPKLD